MTKIFYLFVVIILTLPNFVLADGLVPCGGEGEDPCEFCHFVVLSNNLISWFIMITTILFSVIFVVSGFKLVTSGGNVSAKESAKSMITNAFIGFIIVLAAWLLVDTVMKSLLSEDGQARLGPWNAFECVTQPVLSAGSKIFHPTPNSSRGVAYEPAAGPISEALLATLANLSAPDDKVIAAAAANGLDAEQTKNLQALMRVESGGCRSKTSPVGAQGCMQIMPATARQYSSDLANMSDADIIAKLRDDDDFNIALGARIYADLHQEYDGDERLVFSAYNGGLGANAESVDCPGLRRWQCVWDSPGCYGTNKTSCEVNEGYKETRSYVDKIYGVASKIN